MIKREVAVDWPETLEALHKAGMNDEAICSVLLQRGVPVCRSSLWNITQGKVQTPKYDVGAALLNLLDERTIGRRGNGGSHG